MLATLLGFAGMFALMTLRVPIAFSMGVVGLVGIGLVRSWPTGSRLSISRSAPARNR
jgi:xanthosine utilization system XapX-like protein